MRLWAGLLGHPGCTFEPDLDARALGVNQDVVCAFSADCACMPTQRNKQECRSDRDNSAIGEIICEGLISQRRFLQLCKNDIDYYRDFKFNNT